MNNSCEKWKQLGPGGCSRSGKKWLHALCALLAKPTDVLMDQMWGIHEGKKPGMIAKVFAQATRKMVILPTEIGKLQDIEGIRNWVLDMLRYLLDTQVET